MLLLASKKKGSSRANCKGWASVQKFSFHPGWAIIEDCWEEDVSTVGLYVGFAAVHPVGWDQPKPAANWLRVPTCAAHVLDAFEHIRDTLWILHWASFPVWPYSFCALSIIWTEIFWTMCRCLRYHHENCCSMPQRVYLDGSQYLISSSICMSSKMVAWISLWISS